MTIDQATVKKILENKVKVTYIVSFLILGILAFILLFKIDMGKFHNTKRALKEVTENLDTLKIIVEDRTYISEFDSKFTVSRKNTNWLIETVSDIANAKSVPLRLVRPLESTAFSGYKTISVLMEGNAPYHNIAEFISSLENNDKYIVIENFELGATDVVPFWQAPRPGRSRMPLRPDMRTPGRRIMPGETPGMRLEEESFASVMPEAPVQNQGTALQTERTATFRLTITCFNVIK